MKQTRKPSLVFLTVAITLMIATPSSHAAEATVKLHRDSVVRFATVKEGKAALAKKDRFLDSLSRFDLQSRVQTDKKVSLEDFVGFVTKEVRPWTKEEMNRIRTAVTSIRERLKDYHIPFPKTVLFVKTTGREEGGAAYCRGAAVVLPTNRVQRADRLERLLLHELFHILSANNRELRNKLYALIGFQPCPEIPYPKSLQDRRLTNPDSPKVEHFIRLDQEGKKIDVAPVLFASVENYDPKKGGTFFRYVVFKLMVLEAKGNKRVPKLVDGEPILMSPPSPGSFLKDKLDTSLSDEQKSFLRQIGRNTGYIIHADETLADNFVFMATNKKGLKTPAIVKKMRAVLSQTAKNSKDD